MIRAPYVPLLSSTPLRRLWRRSSRAPAGTGRNGWSLLRTALLTLVLITLWVALLAWAAGVPSGVAFEPAQRLRHDGIDFHVVSGEGINLGRRLGVTAAGADHMAVQSHLLRRAIDASDFPILRHRWQQFPRELELSFMFRRADAPDDVQTVTLPPAGAYPAYFDLSDVPEWHGRIIEIGFAQYPTSQLVPADLAFPSFALVEAELWSPSWRGSLGALGTDWLAYRPWALMSISALGPDAPWPQKSSPVIVLAVGLLASILLAGIVLRRDRRWIGIALCIALGVGWVVLDLRWLGEFSYRHALTRDLYAGKSWTERAAIEPDRALLAAAQRVQQLLAQEPASTHVVVAADTPYTMLRLGYHLLPANVAPVSALMGGTPAAPTLLVAYATREWRFDARRGRLQGPNRAFAASTLFEKGDLRVFRLTSPLQ